MKETKLISLITNLVPKFHTLQSCSLIFKNSSIKSFCQIETKIINENNHYS